MWYIKLLIFSSVFAIICAAASEIEANDLKRSKRAGVVDLNYFLKGLFQKSAALSNAKLVVAKNVINQKFHAKPTTKATTTTTKKPTLKPIVFPPVALHPWFGGFGHYDYDFIKPWYNKAKFVTAAKGVGAGVGVRAGVGAGGPAGPGYINFDYDDYVEGNFPANAANVFRQPRLRTTSTTTTTQAPTTTTTTSTTTTSTTTAAPTTAAPTAAAPPALPPAASLTSRGGYFLPLNQLARFSSSNFNAPLNNAYYDDYGDYGPFVTPRSRAARPRLSNLNAIARATAAPSAAAATATTATPAMRAAPLRAPNARLNQNVLFQYAQRDDISTNSNNAANNNDEDVAVDVSNPNNANNNANISNEAAENNDNDYLDNSNSVPPTMPTIPAAAEQQPLLRQQFRQIPPQFYDNNYAQYPIGNGALLGPNPRPFNPQFIHRGRQPFLAQSSSVSFSRVQTPYASIQTSIGSNDQRYQQEQNAYY